MTGNKGQIGTVYKLLIGAAFAMALLTIAYNYTQTISSPITGLDASKKVLESASEAPDKCFSRNPVLFQKGQLFTGSMLAEYAGIDQSVNVDYDAVSGVFKSNKFTAGIESSVSAQCNSGSCTLYLGSDSC